jgi:UDP-glucose 4-epimerase
MRRSVLVTGVSRYVGSAFARLLQEHPDVEHVIGVDTVDPRYDIGATEFIRADIRTTAAFSVILDHEVDTVVHLGVVATPRSAGGRVAMKETNVLGTMQLLAACQRSSRVKRVVVKSSTSVYGAGPRDPAVFAESDEPTQIPDAGFAKDSVEVEGYVRGFIRRRPDVEVSILRMANIVGPGIDTVLTSYFSLPTPPTVMGFDARFQLLHEEDALASLIRATMGEPVPGGTVNVSGTGVMLMSQAIRRAGRISLPVPPPMVSSVGRVVRRTGIVDFSPDMVAFLTHGRVVDTHRMRERWGFEPAFTTEAAFDDFLVGHGVEPFIWFGQGDPVHERA